MPDKAITVLLLACLAIIGCCCLRGGLVLLAGGGVLESTGELITSPFRWWQPDEAIPDLYRTLDKGTSGVFRIGEPCDFSSVDGNMIQSASDPGNQFARPLTRQEAIDLALASLKEDRYEVEDRTITLDSGTPVRYEELPDEEIFLALDEQSHTESSIATRSLNGVVQDSQLTGSLHLSENRSSVEGGQGVEAASSIDVTFTCSLLWENID